MTQRSRCLLLLPVLPLLLLVPLGVLKWRADWLQDHPTVSQMDRLLRAKFKAGNLVYIFGEGKMWRQLTGLKEVQGFSVEDRALFQQVAQVLRCSERREFITLNAEDDPDYVGYILMRVDNGMGADDFVYTQEDGKKCLTAEIGDSKSTVAIQPRFAPRFEAFITQLAQRAKASGQHPEITLES